MINELENKIEDILQKIRILKNKNNLDKFNYKISCLYYDMDQIDFYINDIISSIENGSFQNTKFY